MSVSDPEASTHEPANKSRHPLLAFLKEVAIVVVGAVIISTVLRVFVLQMFEIPTGSMENTLKPQDRVIVLKFAQHHRGDIVVFKDSFGWLPPTPKDSGPIKKSLEFIGLLPDSSQDHLIKRLIGMPGDTVQCCDGSGRLTVNGVALDEKDYLFANDGVTVKPANVPFKVVVPAGRVFVMGDHRDNSLDSRCHLAQKGINAFIREEDIVGPAVALGFPFDRMKQFTTPAIYGQVPPPSQTPPEKPLIEPANVSC